MMKTDKRRRPQPRHAIVLLIVLGMLSLFTVLIVSFVVFSSQVAQSSSASEQRRLNELLPDPPIDSAVLQLVVGTNDSDSAAYGASLMEDFWGVDGRMLTVGHRIGPTIPAPYSTIQVPASSRGQLLLPLLPNNQPQTTLFKFPTSMAYWFYDPTLPAPAQQPRNVNADLRPHLDDGLSGRIITFDQGPLKNISFRVVRSFGIDNGTNSGSSITNAAEYSLAGNLVIDLSEVGKETIAIDGVPTGLYSAAAISPNSLLYDPGVDELPGRASFDDDGQNGVDDAGELGWPGSDDVGFRFVLNGSVFNGEGVNPSGQTGVVNPVTTNPVDPNAEVEFTLNTRLTGPAYWGGNEPPQFDEAWDAADWENIFLAWQPSDHRRPILTPANQVYSGVDAARLNRQLGQHIIPSFHRPSIINFLMNSPIRIPSDNVDPSTNNPANPYEERTFFDIKQAVASGTTRPNDIRRLEVLVTRIRRATVRPLNFPHEYVNTTLGIVGDMNNDGDPFDGSPQFSGSNSVAILNQTIDVTAPLPQVINQIELLARWLVNGPWDVDNDGDGLPDSIWVDLNLPTVTAPDGRLLKPLVAPLIEDLDGKINVNFAGNYNQLIQPRFNLPALANPTIYPTTRAQYNAVSLALGTFGHGGGVGPAEIDFSHLFAFEPTPSGSFVGPLATTQVERARYLDQVLLTRYGNLLNVRYGGAVYNYAASYPYGATTFSIPPLPAQPLQPFPQNIYPYAIPYSAAVLTNNRATRYLHYPGVGTRLLPFENADPLARIPFPSRTIDHAANVFAGRPMDMSGTEQTLKDQYGSHRINRPYRSADIVNQPYEFGSNEVRGDDTPFSPAEYADFLAGGPLSGRLSQLLSDAAQRNEALTRLVTTESRSVDSPEVPGEVSLLHLFAQRFEDHATQVTAPDASITPPGAEPANSLQSTLLSRMLAVELRKGSKLNLNRQIGNVQDDNTNGFGDEHEEIRSGLLQRSAAPVAFENNTANNRRSPEPAFPQIASGFTGQANAAAHYGPTAMYADPSTVPDFDGIDLNQDGDYADANEGTDIDGDGEAEPIAMGSELLARHLYCLMFALITEDIGSTGELVPNFPYPGDLPDASVNVRNRFVARQLAQWAVNAVDYRDVDVKFTRLRYDPNPFDSNGFSLAQALQNEVWGMERPELQITETIAMHDKRLKRNLTKELDPNDPSVTLDMEGPRDTDTDNNTATPSDSDMDQFRMPQASAFVELKALAPPVTGNNGEAQPSLPAELYFNNQLDLGRTVGTGDAESPVWRMAVGERHNGDHQKSSRWIFDADRLVDLSRAAGTRQDVADYLDDSMDWTMPGTVDTELDAWNEIQRHGADIRRSRLSTDPAQQEFVTLADNDFNPANDVSGPVNNSRIRLERFVWFSRLVPTATLNVVNNAGSGMRRDNVFFNKPNQIDNTDQTLPENAPTLLSPGEYAIVAPRALTYFGQKNVSNLGNGYQYNPSDQKLEFAVQGVAPTQFRLNYFANGNITNPETPRYIEDDATAYDVENVMPIICQSLYPHQTGVAAVNTRWDDYVTAVNNANGYRVEMGFNISAPLPNQDYYPAPEHVINTDYDIDILGNDYLIFDGYRDYDMNIGFHPDSPVDHVAGPSGNLPPLAQDNHEWANIGTHEEAATIFLQRLADPTIPWHATNNPYITVDFMPMDLTTFNGEHDVRQEIIRKVVTPGNNPPGSQVPGPVDERSGWDEASGEFAIEVRFDSRRKIPNTENDRGMSALLQSGAGLQRAVVTHRSPLSMTTSVLRPTTPGAGPQAGPEFWPYNIGSMWFNEAPTAQAALLDTRFRDPTNPINALALDDETAAFTQSLGFVNREYGPPVRSDSPRVGTFGIGSPDHVFMLTVPWMNREYRSPLDLINVPAVSRSRVNATFSPRTLLEDTATREIPTDVWESFEALRNGGTRTFADSHLLGFEAGMSSYRDGDFVGAYGTRQRLGVVENDTTDYDDWTGARAGFEQIFDYVDVGPVWFDSQHWFDPVKIQFRPDRTFDSGTPFQIRLHQMFNRTVETLQPPNNFIGRHRTPGKINLNTTPDYVRKGQNFRGNQSDFLDSLEDPADPTTSLAQSNPISANPNNSSVRGDGFTPDFVNSRLYGNGSVYRSLAWGHSTQYELDFDYGSPASMGRNNRYFERVDTSFGRGFKGFIESRRGYGESAVGSNYMGNPELDYRYPTRFAGVFAPASAARTPSLQRFMRTLDRSASPQPSNGTLPPSMLPMGIPRRTHDMGLLRSHPDFDLRTLTAAERGTLQTQTNTDYSLEVEFDSTTLSVNREEPETATAASSILPNLTPNVNEVSRLRIPLVNSGLLERPQAELHMNRRGLDRDSYFRYQNAARMAGMTTNHSNVFLIRLTMGYFEVDPTTGAVGSEYINETGEPNRSRAIHIIDRTIPVGFLRGKNMNAERTFLYSEIAE